MDSLTHTVLGACLGELIAGKKIGKKAMLIGAIANNLPDVDVVTAFWMSPEDGVLAHRGFTHSFLFILIATPFLAWASKKYLPKTYLTWREWVALIGSGLLVHVLIDACTTYGTGLLEPFSHVRVTFNTLFILDPFILLVCLVTTLALLVLKRNHPTRNRWARNAIVICILYLTSVIGIKFFVNYQVAQNIVSQHISSDKYMASPAPLSSLLWYVAIQSPTGFYTGYYSLFDKAGPIRLEFTNSNEVVVAPYRNSQELQKLRRFSKDYCCFTENSDTVTYSDLRFGTLQGWSREKAPFVFRFYLVKTSESGISVKRTPMEAVSGEAFTSLFQRIKGVE